MATKCLAGSLRTSLRPFFPRRFERHNYTNLGEPV